jgi:hypothetical protein
MELSAALNHASTVDDKFCLYNKLFVAGCHGVSGGFQIQLRDNAWFNPHRKIRDDDVADHLQQMKSVAVIPAYYPIYATLDVDFHDTSAVTIISQVEDKVQQAIEMFQLNNSEYLQFTSPGYEKSGSRHILVPVTYNGKPASSRLIKRILGPIAGKAGIELFPCGGRKTRLPFGYKQFLIDPEDGSPLTYTWQENLHWLTRIDPIDLERYPYQSMHETGADTYGTVNLTVSNSELLWEHGLQAFGTRHPATGTIARRFYFRNQDIDTAKAEIKLWLRSKHNGFSKEITKGNWSLVDAEVDAWAEGTYAFFEKRGIYPTSIHNMTGWLARADVDLILEVFPGDWINQKRFCRLLQHYRARTRGERRWISMHRKIWGSIVGSRYIEFQRALEGKILEINNSYKVGAFSKRIILRLPPAAPAQMICDQEGRAENNWKTILLSVFGNVAAAAQASRINWRRFYE